MGKLLLHNKLGSDYQAEHSEVGPNLTKLGTPLYSEGKFGTGLGRSVNAGFSFDIRTVYSDNTMGALEFWFKPTAEWPSDDGILFQSQSTSGTVPYLYASHNDVGLFEIGFGFDDGDAGVWYTRSNDQIEIGKWYHVAVCWDQINGIAGTDDNIRIYIDGIMVAFDTRPINVSAWHSGVSHIGCQAGPLYSSDAVMDNLKMYDFAKTDFSDRFWEGYPPVMEQQFEQADKAPRIYEHTSYLSGKEIEVPEPDHWWKLDEKSGDVAYDSGKYPVHGVNVGAVSPNQNGYRFHRTTISHIEVPHDPSLNYSTVVSMCGWFWNNINNKGYMFQKGTSTNNYNFMHDDVSNDYPASYGMALSCDGAVHTTPNFYDLGKYHHWVAIIDAPHHFYYIYLDGYLIQSGDWQVSTLPTNSQMLLLGGDESDGNHCLNGYMKNLRLYGKVLNPEEVRAIYEQETAELIETDIPTPDHYYPLDSLMIQDKGRGSLILPDHYYALDETAQSGKPLDSGASISYQAGYGTNTGVTIGATGKHGYAYSFNGTSSTVSVPISNSTVYSVAMWFKANAIEAAGLFSSGTTNPYKPSIMTNTTGRLQVVTRQADPYYTTPNDTYAVGQWCHVALLVNGTDIKFYVNGELIITQTAGGAPETDTVHLIGSRIAEYWFDGDIDETRWYDKILSQQEIISIMNNSDPRRLAYGTLSAVPPALVYDNEMGECLQFGTPKYITLGSSDIMDFEQTDTFEVSVWFKPQGGADWGGFVFKGDYTVLDKGWEVFLSVGKLYLQIRDGASTNLSVATIAVCPAGVWQHGVVQYDGTGNASGVKIYLNGIRQPVTILSDDLGTTTIRNTYIPEIGRRGNSNYFPGRIKDIKVWKK